MTRTLVAALIGVLAGIASGLFGIGGGLVIVPALVLFLRFEQHRAHATSSAVVAITATTGAIRFFSDGAAELTAGLLLAAGAIVGAYTGATLMGRVPARWLKALFVSISFAAAIRLTIGGLGTPGDLLRVDMTVGTIVGIVLLGAATGALMSLLGLGGGLVYVPILALVLGLEQHTAQGTSLVAIVPTAVTATFVNLRARRVDLTAALAIGAGGVAGVLLGAILAFNLAGSTLQMLFAALLVAAATLQLLRKTASVTSE